MALGSHNPIGFLLGTLLRVVTARATHVRRRMELHRVERLTVLHEAHHQPNSAIVMRTAPYSRHKCGLVPARQLLGGNGNPSNTYNLHTEKQAAGFAKGIRWNRGSLGNPAPRFLKNEAPPDDHPTRIERVEAIPMDPAPNTPNR